MVVSFFVCAFIAIVVKVKMESKMDDKSCVNVGFDFMIVKNHRMVAETGSLEIADNLLLRTR